jgi:diadenosine tetraphosphate (Ap4A) HIT family hydrolase
MFDAKKWRGLVEGATCPMCAGADSGLFLADLPSSRIILQNDGDFPGYCILQYKRHVTELHELSREERAQWVEDVAAVATAVQNVCEPYKINYAVLGNLVPHLHCHVIPRRPDDGCWGQPIWARPAGSERRLTADEYFELRERLRSVLKSGVS